MNQEVTWTSEETVREEVVGLGPEPTDIHAPHRPGHGLYARGIGKSYKKREVVKNVSIEVHRGEAVGRPEDVQAAAMTGNRCRSRRRRPPGHAAAELDG